MLSDAGWIEKFHSKVDRSGGPWSCWPWLGGLAGSDGYGGGPSLPMSLGWLKPSGAARALPAHRIAHAFGVGYFSDSQAMRHSPACNAPGGARKLCCNPRHLTPGTDMDNMKDRMHEGTTTTKKVSDVHVMAARVLHGVRPKTFNVRVLSAMFGGTPANMKKIIHRHHRKHAPEWSDVRPAPPQSYQA